MADKAKDDYFEEKHSIWDSIGGLISFSTIIPLNVHTTINDMAKLTWFWPFISGFIGFIGFLIGYFLFNIVSLPALVCGAILYGFFLLINGFHHLDGLIDFGDGVMVHGSPEKKIAVMRDSKIGTGGIGLFFIVAITTVAVFSQLFTLKILLAFIILEMSAKFSLLTVAVSSTPGEDGTGNYFIKYITTKKYLIAILIGAIISFLLLSYVGVFGLIGGLLAGAIVSKISDRNFKMATGDVLGASHEIGRLFASLFILIAFILI
ncbi:MAG: adenosylcobinamide-GDP ribazoletransferase [Methanobrevibacter sp.]|jgi:adenosylcobinamide-GDP ribazoletransferase|nr:adenosylcobinamide-GDP ribazoletransferase [Methanobrevibacter sp.]